MSAKKELPPDTLDVRSEPLSSIMKTEVISVGMDATLGEAMDLCLDRRIRHVPVLDETGQLAGLVTDRDLRAYISPRIGTISENNTARDTLSRRVHVIMTRNLATGFPTTTLAQAAKLMLERKVGCLPIVNRDGSLAGIITTTDLLRIIARYEDRC